MSKDRRHIPKASTLMGALRSMGYSFESAVADVVDNSISAHAQNVRILFPSNPMDELALGILDDGDGMTADVLFEAMRYVWMFVGRGRTRRRRLGPLWNGNEVSIAITMSLPYRSKLRRQDFKWIYLGLQSHS